MLVEISFKIVKARDGKNMIRKSKNATFAPGCNFYCLCQNLSLYYNETVFQLLNYF